MDFCILSEPFQHYNSYNYSTESDSDAFGYAVDFGSRAYDLDKLFLKNYGLNEMDSVKSLSKEEHFAAVMTSLDTFCNSDLPENTMLLVNPKTLEPSQCEPSNLEKLTKSNALSSNSTGQHVIENQNSNFPVIYTPYLNKNVKSEDKHEIFSKELSGPDKRQILTKSRSLLRTSYDSTNSNNISLESSKVNTIQNKPSKKKKQRSLLKINNIKSEERENNRFTKPPYSYSHLPVLAIKNSSTGKLTVTEIYAFIEENFPYYKTAPEGWKNSIRHNLSQNKCFKKFENPAADGNRKKGVLWGMVPGKIGKLYDELERVARNDIQGIKRAMPNPDILLAT